MRHMLTNCAHHTVLTILCSPYYAHYTTLPHQAAYQNNLASLLTGVEPADIALTVTAASVRVVSEISISSPSEAATSAALSDLSSYDSTGLSQARRYPNLNPYPNINPDPNTNTNPNLSQARRYLC